MSVDQKLICCDLVYFVLISQLSPHPCFTVISVGNAFETSGIEKIEAANKQIDAGRVRFIQSCLVIAILSVDVPVMTVVLIMPGLSQLLFQDQQGFY